VAVEKSNLGDEEAVEAYMYVLHTGGGIYRSKVLKPPKSRLGGVVK
jgi:hypothetical protein